MTNQPPTGIDSTGMNRAMRRLAKRADKIVRRGTPKHGIMTQAQKDRHLATAGAVISGSTTYEDDNLDTTLLKIYTAFDALKKGDGTEDHFDYVAAEVAKGVAKVGLDTGVPVVFGVLTTDTIEQAVERAGAKAGNKGWSAAATALEMANLSRALP